MTRPYNKVKLSFLAEELSLTLEDIESLLVDMILDQRLMANIDQINGHLILLGKTSGESSVENKTLRSLATWAETLGNVTINLANKIA